MDDSDHIARLLDGDPETVAAVRSWIRLAFRPYRARLSDDLEDLEQDVLLQLIEALRQGRFHGRCSFRTYVKTYVVHKSIDRLRAAGRRETVAVDELDLPSDAASALDAVVRSENVRVALAVLEEMPEACRELWRMLLGGMRYQEMSRRLGISEGTLRVRVLRCRQRALESRRRLFSPEDGNESPGPTTR